MQHRDSSRKWSSGSATASQAAASPAGMPQTGTAPGAHRGHAMAESFGATERTDNWWLAPLVQAIALSVLGIYATWAAFQGNHYLYEGNGSHYLSPFYSPVIKPAWLPSWFSPALLILWAPLGFRATCYYYRKAYYRAFFADPVACAVGEPRKGYCGELKFPFILQNLHRYFLYVALLFLIVLWWDVVKAFTFNGSQLGIGVGSLAILASTTSLTLYTFSCHSLRHLIGGKLDCFSCAVAGGPRYRGWGWVSFLNGHHMGFAWWSLFFVCFADFYVRMVSMGIWQDLHFLPEFNVPTPIGM
jgi:hypothetical protein